MRRAVTVDEGPALAAGAELDRLRGLTVDDVCPHCQRPGWDDAIGQHARDCLAADAALVNAKKARMEAVAEAARAEQTRQDAAQVLAVAARKAHEQAAEKASEADDATAAATAALRAAEAARDGAADAMARARSSDPAGAWDASYRALGQRPVVPHDAPPAPRAPASERPTDEQHAKAQAALGVASVASSRAADHARLVERLTAAIAKADRDHEAQAGEWAHLHALVEAIRSEPSETLRGQLAALGDLGPVAIDLPDGGGVAITVDGRPWWTASTGRLIVADVWLRDGIRRAIGARWLPIVIDDSQSVAGQELPMPAPCIVLRTEAGPLRVVAS